MTDPADKSDDLIAELAKLMANTPAAGTAPQAAKPEQARPSAGPVPTVRIPGQDQAATRPPASEPRAPAMGIRIPGMDQPAPVSGNAAASRFDFGKPVTAPPIRQEPLSSLSERLAGQNPAPSRVEPQMHAPRAPAPEPVPVVESAPAAPAISVGRQEPQAAAAEPGDAGDFNFDFGFGQKPPVTEAASAPRPAEELDPIADLIEAELVREEAAPVPPVPVTPVAAPAARPAMSTSRPASAPAAPLRPTTPPRAPENDRFGVSPDEGLNLRPSILPSAPAAPRAPEPEITEPLDPMAEIENLIGEAVRVELAPGPARVAAASNVTPVVSLEAEDELEEEIDRHPQAPASNMPPVVPPLTTPFAPRRANLKEDRVATPSYASAEDAIMAAAEASGAEINRLEPSVADESKYRRLKVKPQRAERRGGVSRQYIGMGVAAVLLLAAGLGLYWVVNMGRASTAGAAPELTADTTPVKVKPQAPAKVATDATKSPVLAKMDGNTSTSSEQLVSTDQTNGGNVSRDVTPTAADSESGLANRKVRTVTVRPDGTIVSGDDALAGGEALPIDRPNVPSVPSAETPNLLGDTGATAAPQLTADAVSPAAQPSPLQANDGTPLVNTNLVAPTPQPFPVRSSAAAAKPVNAVVGAQTLDGQIDLLAGGAPQQVAAAQPARATTSNAAAYVQLASMPTEADANAHMRTANARYGSLFGGNQLSVQRVDLGEKGIRYRVRLPAASLIDARNICAQIKSAGGDCLATNG